MTKLIPRAGEQSQALSDMRYYADRGYPLSAAACAAVAAEARRRLACIAPWAAPAGYDVAQEFIRAINLATSAPLVGDDRDERIDAVAEAIAEFPAACFNHEVLNRARRQFSHFPGAKEMSDLLRDEPGARLPTEVASLLRILEAAELPPAPVRPALPRPTIPPGPASGSLAELTRHLTTQHAPSRARAPVRTPAEQLVELQRMIEADQAGTAASAPQVTPPEATRTSCSAA